MPEPSYLGKLRRAEEHLIDLERELGRYIVSQPYTVSESVEGKKKRKVRRLEFTIDPAATAMPYIIADAVYNLRSSLDHLMGALVPKTQRSKVIFPIFFEGVWESGPEGENAQRMKERGRWASDVKALPADAIAVLKGLQPSNQAGDDHVLAVLNRLSNRDRHHKLPVAAAGLRNAAVEWTMPDGSRQLEIVDVSFDPRILLKDGAELTNLPYRAMDVKIYGTPAVVIAVGGNDWNLVIPKELNRITHVIAEVVIPQLQPFVRSDADV